MTFAGGRAPYFSLELRGWVPCVVSWDPGILRTAARHNQVNVGV